MRDSYLKMYLTLNEVIFFFVAERVIRTLKEIVINSISKNVYIDKLDDIVNKYNNTHHSTVNMKSVDVIQPHLLKTNKEDPKC